MEKHSRVDVVVVVEVVVVVVAVVGGGSSGCVYDSGAVGQSGIFPWEEYWCRRGVVGMYKVEGSSSSGTADTEACTYFICILDGLRLIGYEYGGIVICCYWYYQGHHGGLWGGEWGSAVRVHIQTVQQIHVGEDEGKRVV